MVISGYFSTGMVVSLAGRGKHCHYARQIAIYLRKNIFAEFYGPEFIFGLASLFGLSQWFLRMYFVFGSGHSITQEAGKIRKNLEVSVKGNFTRDA